MSKPTAYPVEGKPSSVAYHVNSAAYPVAVNSAAYPVAECRGDDIVEHPKQQRAGDPVERLALQRKEFGEHGGLNLSVEASTAFTVLSATTMPKIFQGEMGSDERGPMGGCYLYSRHFNPTVWALGRQLAAMEGAEAAYCTSSGLGAISSALLGMLNHGDHIVASDTLYGGTYAMLADFFSAKCGIHTSFVDMMDPEAVALACTVHMGKIWRIRTGFGFRIRIPGTWRRRRSNKARAAGAIFLSYSDFCLIRTLRIRHNSIRQE